MKIRLSELRKMIREELTEMKLGLSSASRGEVPAAQPFGSPEGDIIDFQRDTEADEYDDFMLGKIGKFSSIPLRLDRS